MGAAEWDFGSSWATTLTTVGAVLGTVLSAELLADTESLTFVSLNLLFGVVVVIAGLVYSAFNRLETVEGDNGEEEKQNQGLVGFFVVACALTLWAVAGELLTILALLRAIDGATDVSSLVLNLFAAFIWLALVCVVIYTWQAMQSTLEALAVSRDASQVSFFATPRDLEIITVEPQEQEGAPAEERGQRVLRVQSRRMENPPLPRWSVL
jgi:hypothetical protein